MEIAVRSIQAEANRHTFEIHHITDTHADDPDHAANELAERIKHIADTPNAYWIGGGDYGSLILPNDPRFQTGSHAVHRLPDVYVESTTDVFWPIREKCLGFGTGNHEWTIGKHYHRGVGAEVAMRLGIPDLYLGSRGWCITQFEWHERRVTMKSYQFHGWSAGRLKGRKALQAERDLGAWNADALFLGHDHQPYDDIWYTEEPKGSKAGWRIHQRPRAFINGGSWTYGQRHPATTEVKKNRRASEWPNEQWVEQKNFRPQPPANPVLLVHVDFGSSANKEKDYDGRAAGFDFEIHKRGNRYVF